MKSEKVLIEHFNAANEPIFGVNVAEISSFVGLNGGFNTLDELETGLVAIEDEAGITVARANGLINMRFNGTDRLIQRDILMITDNDTGDYTIYTKVGS